MPVTSLTELQEALRTAPPGATIQLAPGEYPGPLVIDRPVTLSGLERKTVLWRRGGPVIYIRASGVRLDSLLVERTVEGEGPLVVHDAGCTPIGKESMQVDTLISLGELIPGSTLLLPLEIQTAARAEIAITGMYGARVSPTTLDTPGKHLVWLSLDGKTLLRGEILLGEMTLREGNATRYLWLSGTVLDSAPREANFCLAAKKTKLFPSISGLMLDGTQLSALDGGQALTGRYAFVGRDGSTGALFVHLPGKPPAPVMVNGLALDPLTRVLLHEKDIIKIGSVTLTVQPSEALPFDLAPQSLNFAEFDEHFPDTLALSLDTGKSAWKGRAVATVPWLDVTPTGDLRVPATRSHTWTVQLNSEALSLPNGLHEINGGVMVISSSAVVSVDVQINVRRPDVLLQVAPLDVGAVEWNWPTDRVLNVAVGNVGRVAWTGTVRSGVPWLEVVTPMPITCGAWSEVNAEARFVPAWEQLPVGIHEIPGALVVAGPDGDIPVTVRIEITPAHGHLTVLAEIVTFDAVERNAPLPDAILQVRNDGGGVWTGTVSAVTNWVRANPDQITLEPGASADIEISLLDVPAELALDTPVLIDEIQFAEAGDATAEAVTVSVQMTVVELPPYLVASPVHFPPFVKGDNAPEAQLRIYNNGPSRWKGAVTANLPWLTVPQGLFTCEPGDNVPITVALNGKAPGAISVGFSQWDDALEIIGGRDRITAPVYVDLREPISSIHLDTPTLNFGQFDGASTGELPAQPLRLINASPAAWRGKVELGPVWLSLRGPARVFDLEVPGMNVAEFAIVLNDAARYLSPGVTMEDRAVVITASDQELAARALIVLNEWSPLVDVSPEKLVLSGNGAQKITARNTGSQRWTLQVQAAPWLEVTPVEFGLEPGQEQVIEAHRAIGPFADMTGDPRAIVIIGQGREVSVEVEIAESGG